MDLKTLLSKADWTQERLARELRIGQPSVSKWLTRGRLPAERVLEVERLTGVSRHDLRPDLYPREGAEPQRPAA